MKNFPIKLPCFQASDKREGECIMMDASADYTAAVHSTHSGLR